MLKKLIPITGKMHQQDLSKVTDLKRSTKEAMRNSFRIVNSQQKRNV